MQNRLIKKEIELILLVVITTIIFILMALTISPEPEEVCNADYCLRVGETLEQIKWEEIKIEEDLR